MIRQNCSLQIVGRYFGKEINAITNDYNNLNWESSWAIRAFRGNMARKIACIQKYIGESSFKLCLALFQWDKLAL